MNNQDEHQVKPPPLRGTLIRGTLWVFAARWLVRLIGLVSTVILARLLVPADFGLVAMATVVIGLTEVLFSLGVDTALIQNHRATREHFDTAWTIGVLQGAAMALLINLLAPFAADYYTDPRVIDLLRFGSFGVFVRSLSNIGLVAFRKELEFSKEFHFLVFAKLMSFCITVGLAWYLRSYWALVAGVVAGNVIGCVLSYVMHPYRPRLSLSRAHEIWGFSQWMLLQNIANYALNQGDKLIIGGGAGAGQMGLYTVSVEVAELPTTELVFPMTRVLVPGFAKLKDDSRRLNAAFLNAFGLIATFTVGAGLGLAVVAEPLVALLLGPKWHEAVPLIQILALYSVVRTLFGLPGNLMVVLGRVRTLTLMCCGQIILLLVGAVMVIGQWGVIGVAWVKLAGGVFYFGLILTRLPHYTDIAVGALLARLWRPLSAGVAMVIVLLAIMPLLPSAPAVTLALAVPSGAMIYAMALSMLWVLVGRPDGAEVFVFEQLHARFKRLHGVPAR